MGQRTDYVVSQIDKENSMRDRYDTNSTPENKAKLQEETNRTDRALKNKAGAGRGDTRPPMSKKWIEK